MIFQRSQMWNSHSWRWAWSQLHDTYGINNPLFFWLWFKAIFYPSRKGRSLESPKLCFWPFPLLALCFSVGWETKNCPQPFNEHWWTNLEIHDSPAQNEPSFPFRSGRNSNGTPWSLKLALNYFFIWVNEPPSVLLTDKSISFQINLRKSYHISTPPFVITVNSRRAPKAD